MKNIDNKFRSKVMKAAWTIYRKSSSTGFGPALKSAWKWAKKNLKDAINHAIEVIGESEKAVKIACTVECPFTDQIINTSFWAPKSILINGHLPNWFFVKKSVEIRERYADYNASGSLIISL